MIFACSTFASMLGPDALLSEFLTTTIPYAYDSCQDFLASKVLSFHHTEMYRNFSFFSPNNATMYILGMKKGALITQLSEGSDF